MTEKSYFFDGASLGDAQEAPYNADLLAGIWYKMFGLSFVYSTSTTYFGVTTTGVNMVITVAAGNALVQGRYYTCTNTALTVPLNTSSLPRIDRVVVRIDKVAHTGRLVLKMGVPGYAPQPAVIQQDESIHEMSIARIYVPAGITALNNYNVIDEREYYGARSSFSTFSDFNDNIMPNSEFMAGAGTNFDTAPAMWTIINTATCTRTTKFDQMMRGTGVRVSCPATGDGIQTTVDKLATSDTLFYTMRLLINVISGEVNVNTGGGSVGSRIPPTGSPVEVMVRCTMAAAYRDLNISITNTSSGAGEFILGQVTLSPGLAGAPFLPRKEVILFGSPITQVPFTTAYTTGTTELNLVDDLVGVAGLITRLDITDGLSSTADSVFAALQDYENNANQLRVEVGRQANSGYAGAQGFVGASYNAAGEQLLQLEVLSPLNTGIGIYHLGCST